MRTGETRYGAGDVLSVPALRKDGTRISVEFTIVAFQDEDGRMVGIAAVMRDVGQVLTVLVNAVGPGRSRFMRRAIVRVNATPDPEEPALQILTWEASVD